MSKQTINRKLFSFFGELSDNNNRDWFEKNNRMKHYQGIESAGLHLRLFKTVPKLDLETIFPNTSPEMRHIDKIKIFAPLVGGLITLGMKFGPLLLGGGTGSTSVSIISGICAAMGTYILKTFSSVKNIIHK